MNKSNPYECAQAGLVFNHLLLRSPNVDPEALTHFCGDPESPLRKLVVSLFTKEEAPAALVPRAEEELLVVVKTRSIPAISSFSSTEGFRKDNNGFGIKFCLGPHFIANFLGMTEGMVPSHEFVTVSKLTRRATNVDILKVLGGEHAEIALAQFHFLIKATAAGKKGNGILLTNGEQNICFMRCKLGMLWPVYARLRATGLWENDIWDIEAFPLADQSNWSAGSQVIFKG